MTFIYILTMINEINQGVTLAPPMEIQAVFMWVVGESPGLNVIQTLLFHSLDMESKSMLQGKSLTCSDHTADSTTPLPEATCSFVVWTRWKLPFCLEYSS